MTATDYDLQFTDTITALYGSAYYTGTSAISLEVPSKYAVALDGRGFILDGAPVWRTSATLRTQQDDREAGELSLNPEGLWRRSASTFELGAGQVMYDDENSQRERFRSSKGLDVWTPGQATLLPDTELQAAVSGSATVVQVVSSIDHVYWADLNTVVRSDLVTQTNVTGSPAAAITSMISVGSYILVGYTGNGVYKIDAGGTTASAWVTDVVTPSLVGWAKGRVIVAVGPAIYNPTTSFASAGALPTAMLDHPDDAFEWVGVAEGTSWIYMGGTSGDKSSIYRTAVRSDGTELDIPTIAGRLPDGETLTSMYGYLGVLILGTTRGFRVAQPNGNGDLVIGSRVDLGVAVETMLGRDTFVYFGWSNYDTISTGIGRMDLSNLTDVDNLVTAYASDLMATAQGQVSGIAFHSGQDAIVFGVNGVGVYKQSATFVAEGTMSTGIIRYGLTEEKVVVGARAGFTGSATVSLALSTDGGAFTAISESGAQERGINFELRATIVRSGATSPVFESMTLFSYPAPKGTWFVDMNLTIAEQVETRDGIQAHMNIAETRRFLKDRFLSKVLVTAQIGNETVQGTVEACRFEDKSEAEEQIGYWNGTAPTSFKVIE